MEPTWKRQMGTLVAGRSPTIDSTRIQLRTLFVILPPYEVCIPQNGGRSAVWTTEGIQGADEGSENLVANEKSLTRF